MISKSGHTWLLLFLILIFTDSKAQPVNAKYNFKHLNVQEGLAQNEVYHFLQDGRGYMWIGTHNGLTLFDGTKTTNFLNIEKDSLSIAGTFITSILEDSSQQIWIGNENGINRYNRGSNNFTHFAVDRPGGKKDTTYCVLLGFNAANELWFLDTRTRTVRSLNTVSKKTELISELNAVHASFYKGSKPGTADIWSCYDKGTIHQRFENGKLRDQHTYFTGKGEPGFGVLHVLQQNDSTVWISANEGLVRLNPVTGNYKAYNNQQSIIKELRYSAIAPNGELWVATGPGGVYTFDTKTNLFLDNFRFDRTDPLSICSNNIVSLYFDRMGNVWCGSFGGGASYAHVRSAFFNKHISKNDVEPWEHETNVTGIAVDSENNFWCTFASIGGFMVLDKDLNFKKRIYTELENGAKFGDYINKFVFENDKGQMWFATNKGLLLYDIKTNRARSIPYPLFSEELMGSIWINDLIKLKDGSVIFSTFSGLYRVTQEKSGPIVRPFSSLNQGHFFGFRRLFQDGDGFLYVKSMSELLYVLKPVGGDSGYALVKQLDITPDINHFYFDEEKKLTWIATTAGLYEISSNDFILKKSEINNRLSFSNIRIVYKKNSLLWIFGEKGLYVFDEKNSTGRTLTVEDGLPSNEFNLSAIAFTQEQMCVAGTSKGLVSFYPGQFQQFVVVPRAQLNSIYINDILVSSGPGANETKKINLSPGQNTFSLDFSAIAFQHIADYRFEYKLEGYDEGWIKSANTRSIRYSRIPPGDYTLNLRVMDPGGKLSLHEKILEVHIAKTFWQTIWFRTILLVLIAAFGSVAFRLYFRERIKKQKREFEKLQAIEKERTRIATDMHDDLGAGLSRIKFLSQSLRNKDPKDESIQTALEKITGYSDEMTEKMGEIVWALNEKNDTLADLVAYTRAYAVEYLANHEIKCDASTPMHLPATFIPGEMRRNIFLTVKECLHNVVKHANASSVYFSVELNGKIQIIIHDNGKGIDLENRRPYSNGVTNIYERMKEINGSAAIVNDRGTKVLLEIPLLL